MIGTGGVGKTSLIEALGGHSPKKNQKFKTILEYELSGDEFQMKLYEYPGYGCYNYNATKFWSEFRPSLSDTDMVIIMIDNRILKNDVEFLQNMQKYQLPFIIVRPKSDIAVNAILQSEKSLDYPDASEEAKKWAIQQLQEMVAADVKKVMGEENEEKLYVVNSHSLKDRNSNIFPTIDEKKLLEKLGVVHKEENSTDSPIQ